MAYSKLFKNNIIKIIFIIIFSYLFFLIYSSSCYADTFEIPIDDNNSITLPSWVEDRNYGVFSKFLSNRVYTILIILDEGETQLNYSNVNNSYDKLINRPVTRYGSSSYDFSSFTEQMATSYTWTSNSSTNCTVEKGIFDNPDFYYSNFDVFDLDNNSTSLDSNVYVKPKFDTPVSDIENLQFSYLLISPNDYGVSDPLYLHRLEVSYIVPDGNNSTYYYSDQIFRLDSSSPYFEELGDSGSGVYYYGIPFYKFQFLKDSQYILFISSSPEGINNSNGPITSPFRDDIFQLVNLDTTNKLTDNQVITSFYQNNSDNTEDIVNNTQDTKDNTDDIKESTQNIEGFLTDGSVSSSTEGDINSSLNFDNSNDALNNQNSGFFTRLTSLVSSLATYNLGDDTSVVIPLPNSHGKTITLHSQDIYEGVNGTLRSIINAFWLFVFMFYLWRFINKIYIAVSTGNILDTFSSSGEAITQSML